MSVRFSVLGSGSQGNASLLQVDGFGILIDAGFGPRQLLWRLQAIGASWSDVHCALLTHTHADHRNERSLKQLYERRIPLHCHGEHERHLGASSQFFHHLKKAGLVRCFRRGDEVTLTPGITCMPIPICHDGGATFGFRVEGKGDLFQRAWAMAYATDLGCFDDDVIAACRGVDVLALEFNHDVRMQLTSGRPRDLIERVLGDKGHLSNEQAGAFLAAILASAGSHRLHHVVQLHLSQQCNEPELSRTAAQRVLRQHQHPAQVHVACQHEPGPSIWLDEPLAALTA